MKKRNDTTSLLPAEVNGLVFITGRYGVGKSLLAATADRPHTTAFFDFDNKGHYLHEKLNFGYFADVMADIVATDGTSYDPLALYRKIDALFSDLPANTYSVAVLDNIEPLENALAAEVARDPKAYGVKPANVATGSYGGVYPGVSVLVGRMVAMLRSKGIQLIEATAHIKAVWSSNGVVPNKGKPRGVGRWQELSMLTLALIPGDVPPIPSAVVYKEAFGNVAFDESAGDFVVKRRLPTRLPRATWAEIRRYLKDGVNFDKPQPGEIASADEYGEFSDKYTGPQMEFIRLSAEAAARGIAVMGEDGPAVPPPASTPEPPKVKAPGGNGNDNGAGSAGDRLDYTRVYTVARTMDKFKEAQELFRAGRTPKEVWDTLALK